MATDDRSAAYEALFEANFDALLAYARRRTDQLSDAEDVVAETFVVAWRRWNDVPKPPNERRLWLYGVARRVLANHRRAAGRRLRLVDRLRAELRPSGPRPHGDVAAALSELSDTDREILRLAAWEGLTHGEVAAVLEVSPNAAAIRLHRARQRLTAVMKETARDGTSPGWKGNVSAARHGEESR